VEVRRGLPSSIHVIDGVQESSDEPMVLDQLGTPDRMACCSRRG
jgi:hypothetical protein